MKVKTVEEIRKIRKDSERAFKLMTICQFIAARTPMVLGYATHNRVIGEITQLTGQLGSTVETGNIIASQEWQAIKKILSI